MKFASLRRSIFGPTRAERELEAQLSYLDSCVRLAVAVVALVPSRKPAAEEYVHELPSQRRAGDDLAAAEQLRVVCAWCGAVLCEGAPGAETSHGVCEACRASGQADRAPFAHGAFAAPWPKVS